MAYFFVAQHSAKHVGTSLEMRQVKKGGKARWQARIAAEVSVRANKAMFHGIHDKPCRLVNIEFLHDVHSVALYRPDTEK